MTFRKSAAIGFAAVSMSLLAYSAQAANLVTNGGFESCSGIPAQTDPSASKTSFVACAPTGWTGGGSLTYVDAPGTADGSGYLQVYGPFPYASPAGGNFVEADGDPSYSGSFSQTITGLTAGASYVLRFYQAAGQQYGFTGPTTERWDVTFGTVTQDSAMYSLPQGGVGPWELQTMTFVATAATQVLTFLASGTPNGAPPISFLDGVSLNAVPEPASLSLLGVGIAGLAAGLRRRAGRSKAA